MLRKFVQCARVEERLAMLSDENASDWTSEELNAAMEIVGAAVNTASDVEKIQAIRETLEKNAKEALSDEFVSRARAIADSIVEKKEETDSQKNLENAQLLYGAAMSTGMGHR